ncbi:unnamed protein product [Alopecurus aequalis]
MDTTPIELEALERVFSDATAEPIRLSYGLLKCVTDDFSNEIGRGGFGVVFLGCLQNGKIAVKKLSNIHGFSNKQFLDEIKCLIRVKHKNIVRFLGYCSDTLGEVATFDGAYVLAEVQVRLLCFEYVPNGDIQKYIKENPFGDDWRLRYKMINGICQGLQYLHEERIGHLDLKPENVMLDSNMEPKIADFGLSRFLAKGKSVIFTTNISGTMGYMAPETMTRGQLSFMSDIYALGIIVIKLLIGPTNIDFDNWHESLGRDCPQMKSCIDIARACVEIDQSNRPTIGEITDILNHVGNTNSSVNQESSPAFPWTDEFDAAPLELVFPFITNSLLSCSVALSNNTDGAVGFIVYPYCRNRYAIEQMSAGILTPMSTRAVLVVLSKQAELVPLEDDRMIIRIFTMRSNTEVRELIRNIANWDSLEEMDKHLKTRGGLTHWAIATAVLCERDATKIPKIVEVSTSETLVEIKSMEAHPTEPWVLVQKDQWTIFVCDWQTREIIFHHRSAACAKFIFRDEWLVIGDGFGRVFVYTCPNRDVVVTKFDAHDGCVTSLAVHPTHALLMSSGGHNSLKIWNWEQNWSCIRELNSTSPVRQLMFDPSNLDAFATLGEDKRVKLWTLDCSEPIATSEAFEGFRIDYIFSYNKNHHLITAISGPNAYIWDMDKEKLVHTFSNEFDLVAIVCHPTSPLLITASSEGYIHVWDSTTYRLKKEYRDFLPTGIRDIALIGLSRLAIAHGIDKISFLDIDLELDSIA